MKMNNDLVACIGSGREARVTLNCDAVLTESDGCTVDVMIVDVSRHGFRVQSLAELQIGSDVLLQMDRLPGVRGKISWTCGHQAGGVFLDPVAL